MPFDSFWLGLFAPKFYESQIGYIMTDSPNFLAAGVFYLLFIFGMVVFVIDPGVHRDTLLQAVSRGALFGLVAYATYDLTNLPHWKAGPSLE